MWYRAAVLLIALLFLTGFVSAQDATEETTWYWAIRQEAGETTPYIADQILAYNLSGEVNLLLEDVWISYLYRLDSHSALAFLLVDNELVPYKFDNVSAQALTSSIDHEILYRMTGWGLRIKAAAHPYFFIMSRSVAQEFLILDVSRNTLQLVPAPSDTRYCRNYFHDCASISEDGQGVRYLVSAQWDSGETWFELKEYIISTDEERTIYSYSNTKSRPDHVRVSCEPDDYGDRWLCQEQIASPEEDSFRYWIVYDDGTSQVIELEMARRWRIFFADNNLVYFDEFCDADCAIEISVPENPNPMQYLLTERFNQMYYLVPVDEARLLLFMSVGKYLLSGDSLEYLGETLCCPPADLLSENRRWILVYSSDTRKYRVWDLANGVLALEISIETSPLVYYGESGFVFSDYSDEATRQSLLYHDNMLVELPVGGVYFQVMPNNTLLYEQVAEDEELTHGIYRYDPMDNSFTLLVPNAHRLRAISQTD
jgi:hypothetical protein